MKSLKDLDLKGKRVLMRVDFNVPLEEGRVEDDTRIQAALPTIKYCIEKGGKLILMSHLGRPKGKIDLSLSLKPVAERLSELLGKDVRFMPCCVGEENEKASKEMQEGDVMLLENTRFHSEEKNNDPEYAKKLAKLGDVYVNDAFGTAHRAHASTEGVAHLFEEKSPGFLMEKELKYLKDALQSPERPFIAILGGAKVGDKLGVIDNLLPKVDKILIGGGMAFTFFKSLGYAIGDSILEEDKVGLTKELLDKAGEKIMLPEDIVAGDKFEATADSKYVNAKSIPHNWRGMDIGKSTVKKYIDELKSAKTIIWNGPMGVFEFNKFAYGTKALADFIGKLGRKGVTIIVGGGDTVSAVRKFRIDKFLTHVSTGGGTSLELLAGKELPAIRVLST